MVLVLLVLVFTAHRDLDTVPRLDHSSSETEGVSADAEVVGPHSVTVVSESSSCVASA